MKNNDVRLIRVPLNIVVETAIEHLLYPISITKPTVNGGDCYYVNNTEQAKNILSTPDLTLAGVTQIMLVKGVLYVDCKTKGSYVVANGYMDEVKDSIEDMDTCASFIDLCIDKRGSLNTYEKPKQTEGNVAAL